MKESDFERLMDKMGRIDDYAYKTYDIDDEYNQRIIHEKDKYRGDLERLIEKKMYEEREREKFRILPLRQTDEEKLDSIDIQVIEKYLRKKKLATLNEKTNNSKHPEQP